MMPIKDLKGKRFGKLVAVEVDHISRDHHCVYWLCKCDCGNNKAIRSDALRTGVTKSCGCYHPEEKPRRKPVLKIGQSQKNALYRGYRYAAKQREIEFSLSVETFERLIALDCFYCGCKPSTKSRTLNRFGDFYYNGIDRLDSSKGYIEGNVVPCCKKCNLGKRDYSYEEFVNWIKRTADHLNAKEVSNALLNNAF
jgi:hypothetical protein